MSLYKHTLKVDNKLNKAGNMVLQETRERTRKLFGIVIQNVYFDRNTEVMDIDVKPEDTSMGFKNT